MENLNQVQPSGTSVQSQVLSQTSSTSSPIFTPAPRKSNSLIIVLVIILILIALCCSCFAGVVILGARDGSGNYSFNFGSDLTLSPTPTTEITQTPILNSGLDKPDFINGLDKPAASSNFSAEVIKRQRKLTINEGYYTNINALGDPSYTFSLLYKPAWTTTKFDKNNFILTSPDRRVSTGVLYFDKNTIAYSKSCYEIVESIFEEYDWTGKDEGQININGDKWNRIRYIVDKGTIDESEGVDQCLKREDGVILYFFIATKNEWNMRKGEYDKVINDIYVSAESLEY